MESVFDTFSTDDILVDWKWKGKPLSDEAIATLKDEAKALSTSLLWKVLRGELQWVAVKTLLEKGKEADDIRAAQLLGLMTLVIEQKLKQMSE